MIDSRPSSRLATVCLLALVTIARGQSFRAIPVDGMSRTSIPGIGVASVYKMDHRAIDEYIRKSTNGTSLTLQFGHETFTWSIHEKPMLRPGTRGQTMRNGRPVDLDIVNIQRTFMGYRDGDRAESRITISPRMFAALIQEQQRTLLIQPYRQIVREAPDDWVVLVDVADRVKSGSSRCGVPDPLAPQSFFPEHARERAGTRPSGSLRTYNCLEMQVTFATDNQMWQEYEDVELLLDFNLTVLNFMEPFFDDLDIDFWVDEFFMVTESANAANPWGTEFDLDELIDDFGSWAEDWFSSEDIGHLWSAADLHIDGDFGYLGLAYIGGACNDIGIYPWTIVERFTATDFYDLAILQAHEYGHLLDAEHTPGTGTIMEPSIGDVESASWAAVSLEEMNDFIEDEPCIQTCIQCPVTYNIMDYIGWGDWRYSAAAFVTSTAVIDNTADVTFQSPGFVRMTPGFQATSHGSGSNTTRFVAKVAPCE